MFCLLFSVIRVLLSSVFCHLVVLFFLKLCYVRETEIDRSLQHPHSNSNSKYFSNKITITIKLSVLIVAWLVYVLSCKQHRKYVVDTLTHGVK